MSRERKSRWRRGLLVFLAFALAAFVYSRQFHPEQENVASQRGQLAKRVRAELPPRVDSISLLGDVKALSAAGMQGRAVGTPGGRKARDYLLARYAAIGLLPVAGPGFEQAFSFARGRGFMFWRSRFWQTPTDTTGVNLIGQVRGTIEPDKYLLITAHFDHLGIREGKLYPGADDNASGVAALLAAASYFRAHPPRHSMLFVAFDGEELGLRGSRAFLEQPPIPLSSMLVDVNFDMLSRNPAGEIFLAGLYANPQLKGLLDPVRAAAAPTILYGHDHPRPFWDMDDWTTQSDQGSFADKQIPFLYLGVEDHPDYHQPTDTFERIDRDFFVGVANSSIDLIAALDAADAAQLSKRR